MLTEVSATPFRIQHGIYAINHFISGYACLSTRIMKFTILEFIYSYILFSILTSYANLFFCAFKHLNFNTFIPTIQHLIVSSMCALCVRCCQSQAITSVKPHLEMLIRVRQKSLHCPRNRHRGHYLLRHSSRSRKVLV